MRERLPPLFSLQVFESAARLGTFSRAATELSVTVGAVSRQIRQLEDWCGLTLFERHGPRVRITSEGQDLLARLGGPLSALRDAVDPTPDDARQPVYVATLASIANAWLLPRLPDFVRMHPEIRLVVQTDHALTRPAPRVPMVILRHGARPSENLQCEMLFEDRLVAVAAPALALKISSREITQWPADIWLKHLSLDGRPWFVAAGMAEHFEAEGHAFNDADVLLNAAERGMGAALTRLSVVWPRLQSGALVLACRVVCRSEWDNLLISREDSGQLNSVRKFTRWIRDQAAIWRKSLAEFDASHHFLRPAKRVDTRGRAR